MIHPLFAIKDKALESFFPPFPHENNRGAIRQVITMAKNPDSQLHHFPADFELFRIGEWHTDTGFILAAAPTMVSIGTVEALQRKGLDNAA